MGVLNNSKSSVVDRYNVATISGGHSTYANGGVGGIAGQFGDGSIANSYNYGNVTLGENLVCDNLGCFILRSGKYPELEMAADLVGGDPVLTVVLKDSHGSVTGEQSFTARQLSGLSQTGAVGYQYWKRGAENLVAATKYVTLETLLKAAGADFTPGMTVTAADATGFGSTLSYQDYQTCRWYIDGSGVKSDAPAALALCWNSGEGTVEQVAAGAVDTDSIRFCYGISEDQYGSAAGKRLVSGVVTLTVQPCVHTHTQDVPGTPATCTESGLTDGHLCLICGQVHGQEVLDALGHDFGEWTVEKAATCTEDGLESRTCSRCQETEERTIQALGHTPELRDAKDADCTQDGYTGDTYCSVCGQLLTRGQVIPAKGHDYQDGKCTVCGAEDPNYQPEQPDQPEQPTQPENPGVKTGDESYVVLWSAALLLGGAALVLLPRKKRS